MAKDRAGGDAVGGALRREAGIIINRNVPRAEKLAAVAAIHRRTGDAAETRKISAALGLDLEELVAQRG